MKKLPTAATAAPTTTVNYADFTGRVREQVAATMPEARRGGRQFEMPQSTADLFGRVADSIREHGITPEQAEALQEVIRTAGPTGAARQVLDLIEADTCTALNGRCVDHENDFGDIIHTGPEASITIGTSDGLLPIHLVKWGDNTPYIVAGWDTIELDVAAADEAIHAEREHYAAFIAARTDLAALTTEPSPEPGHYQWCAQGACTPVYKDGDEMEHVGPWLVLSEDVGGENSAIEMRHPGLGFLAAQLGRGEKDAAEVLLRYEGNTCGLDAQQFDAFIEQVADFHAGLVAMRRQMDAKRAAK